jgi:hypothetical protein
MFVAIETAKGCRWTAGHRTDTAPFLTITPGIALAKSSLASHMRASIDDYEPSHTPMSPSLSPDIADTLRLTALQKRERLMLLSGKHGIAPADAVGLDRTGLMRIADTLDFLSNNLPPNALEE